MRSLLAERRQQESAADQAGVTFLNATKQSGHGMLATFERFRAGVHLGCPEEAFARSHPLSTDRLARLRQLVETSPYYNNKDSAELQLRHDLMRAKLSGYLEKPHAILNRYPRATRRFPPVTPVPWRATSRAAPARSRGRSPSRRPDRRRPTYPYFWEVKGDLLMRAGRNAEAIPSYVRR